jgi:xanthine dehydrogenase YagS FAD-binding subunit
VAEAVLPPDLAAEAELAEASGLRDNTFKIELGKRVIEAVLSELAGESA